MPGAEHGNEDARVSIKILTISPGTQRHEHQASPIVDSRLRTRRILGRSIRREGEPEAGADYRPRTRWPVDDDHRRRQLASGRRWGAGPGFDDAISKTRRALRDRNHLRPHSYRGAQAPAIPPDRRHGRIHLRRADHRYRRLGEISWHRFGAGVYG